VDEFLYFEFALKELFSDLFEGLRDLSELSTLVVLHVLQF